MSLPLFYGDRRSGLSPRLLHPKSPLRRLVETVRPVRGPERVVKNLCAGLELLGVSYRLHCTPAHARATSGPLCLLGKTSLVHEVEASGPVLLGPLACSHPSEIAAVRRRLHVARLLVPCAWMVELFRRHGIEDVHAWPVGTDLGYWSPARGRRHARSSKRILVYEKMFWQPEAERLGLIRQLVAQLSARGYEAQVVRYGRYSPRAFRAALRRADALVFLSEHETQGLAYQEALAVDVPVVALDAGGEWRDPRFWPHLERFAPVTTVPYWDARCGLRASHPRELVPQLDALWARLREGRIAPRAFMEDGLGLAACARAFVQHWESARAAGA